MEIIVIRRNESDEYEVPMGENEFGGREIYYTDDLDDAYDTARKHHGQLCAIRAEAGSYGE